MVKNFMSLRRVVVLLRRTSSLRATLVDRWIKESRNGRRMGDPVNLYSPLQRSDCLISAVEAWRFRPLITISEG